MIDLKQLHFPSVGILLASACFLLSGCGPGGPPRAAVEGAVTFDGAMVDGGRIMFIATDKAGVNAHADIESGKYSLKANKGPSVGTHRVEIVWYKKTGKQKVGSDPPNLVDERTQVIPKEYNTKSTKTEDVKPGMNTFNFDLKSK